MKFDLTQNIDFRFLGQTSFTLTPKTYQSFDVEFRPQEPGSKTWTISMQTLLNPYENWKIMVKGEGFYEDITFEGLPLELEDEINLDDCIINVEKRHTFFIRNNSNAQIKFNWNTQGSEEFTLVPKVGHLDRRGTKAVTLFFKANKPNTFKNFLLSCETKQINQTKTQKESINEFIDWDDSKTIVRYVTKTEYDWAIRKREEEIQKKREEELLISQQTKKGGKKQDKKPGKQVKEEPKEQMPYIDPNEDANVALEEFIVEPEFVIIEKTEKNIPLKASAVVDYCKYDVEVKQIYFNPTLMFTSRIFR